MSKCEPGLGVGQLRPSMNAAGSRGSDYSSGGEPDSYLAQEGLAAKPLLDRAEPRIAECHVETHCPRSYVVGAAQGQRVVDWRFGRVHLELDQGVRHDAGARQRGSA